MLPDSEHLLPQCVRVALSRVPPCVDTERNPELCELFGATELRHIESRVCVKELYDASNPVVLLALPGQRRPCGLFASRSFAKVSFGSFNARAI